MKPRGWKLDPAWVALERIRVRERAERQALMREHSVRIAEYNARSKLHLTKYLEAEKP